MMNTNNDIATATTFVGGKKSGYPVFMSSLASLPQAVASYCNDASRVIVVVDGTVYKLHKAVIDRLTRALSSKSDLIQLQISERRKNAKTLLSVVDDLIDCGADRSSVVLAIGGGVTTDIVGCAAALCLRGIRWGAVPTTLLGMVDAAIGGKTGVNTRAGKNLLGAFWKPEFVALAPEFTNTQKERDFRDGLAEALKHTALVGRPSISLISSALDNRTVFTDKQLERLVFQAVRVKVGIVSKDERESGIRAWLNFGHTFAHAIEHAAGYGAISHGRAVAAGIVGALHLSQALGMRPDERIERIRSSALRIAAGKAVDVNESAALEALGADKKRTGDKQNFVLLRGVSDPYLAPVGDRRLIRSSLRVALRALATADSKR